MDSVVTQSGNWRQYIISVLKISQLKRVDLMGKIAYFAYFAKLLSSLLLLKVISEYTLHYKMCLPCRAINRVLNSV